MFAKFSVKKPYTVIVAVVFVLILGVISLTNMTTDLLPSLNLPYAVISTTYVGASPETVEMTVTRAIEQRMASISNIKNISSVSREHVSMVILEFNETTNMDSAVIEMRESLDMIKGLMPEGVGSPMIMKLNPDMMPIMALSVSMEGLSIGDASKYIETVVIPEIESVEGVASVSVSGLVEEAIHVVISEEKIKAINTQLGGMMILDLSKEMVSGILKGQNFSMPAGYVLEDGTEYLVRAGDAIESMEALENLTIMHLPLPMAPMDIALKDIADVFFVDNSGDMYSKINGNDSVTLTIQKQTEYATAKVTESVRTKIAGIQNRDEGISIVSLLDQGEYIDMVVQSIGMNLIYGGLLAIFVLIIFLRDLRPTLVVGLSIPISVVTAFVLMYFSNITLNIISMGGLALGVGMLVDNSIVVIENIYRLRNEGRSATQASIEGATQVAGAIMASTLTTIAVFLPIVFTQGLTRQIFQDMGLTIAYSLLASLLIALTLVPMLASKMLGKKAKEEHPVMDGIKKIYLSILRFSLKHKIAVILLILILFAGSMYGAIQMGAELFPASDMGQISATLTLPKGTSFDEAVAAADQVYERLLGIEEIETIGASIGGGMMGGMMGGSGSDAVSFNIVLKEDRKLSTEAVSDKIKARTSSVNGEFTVSASDMMMGGLGDSGIAITIKGRDFETLETIAKDISKMVSAVEGTETVSSGLEETSPEFKVTVDKDKSIAKGLTVANVFMRLNEALADERAATILSVGANDFDVFVKDDRLNNQWTLKDISKITFESPYGEDVAITDIASVDEVSGFKTINRQGQQRYVTVSADIASGYNVSQVSQKVSEQVRNYVVPEGYTIHVGGEQESIDDAFGDLFLMLAAGIAFIYLIMVAQFQSLRSPFIVMFTIPLAFTGGFLGLILTGTPLSMVSMIGLIILTGIVVNNGIVFVDYTNKMREEGLSKYDAIIKTGKDRMRPIMMTALTTIFALSTLSLGAGEGTEMMQPMAITAIGGLIYATLLTLIFIPILYDVFHKGE